MKLDWDLIRLLLVGANENRLHEITGYNVTTILYHWYLMHNEGYVDATRWHGLLTPEGKELAEILRDGAKYREAVEIIRAHDCEPTRDILIALILKMKN